MKVIEMKEAKMESQPIRAVMYGEAGAGKTHLMREFPKPMIVYDFDGKYEPLLGCDGITVKSFYIEEKKESKKAWIEFWREYKADKKDPEIKTMVFDSLTSLDTIVWNAAIMMMGKDPDDKESYKSYIQPLYGDLLSTYNTLFNSMKCGGKHCILLAHETFNRNKEGVLQSVSPLVSGSMKEKLCAIFKDTWYLQSIGSGANMRRELHYKKFKLRTCASVMMNGDGVIVDPTYDKIVAEFRT
jgi:hypothetical protein